MPTDRYMKAVLTVIAASLVVLIVQNAVNGAGAQQSGLACSVTSPCYVTNIGLTPLNVTSAHTVVQTNGGQLRGVPPNSGQFRTH